MDVELENMDVETPVRPEAANAPSSQPQVDADGTPLTLPDEGKDPSVEKEDETGGLTEQEEAKEGEEADENGNPKSKFDEPGRVRRFATILNLLNSLLGAGILGVPYAMQYIGLVPSCILLAIIAALSHLCTVLTVKLQRRANATGLDDLALKVLGKIGSVALSILSMLFLYSAEVSYLIIGTDSIMSWLRNAGLNISTGWKRSICVLIFWAVIPGALTIPRKISFISYFSYVNFTCIGWFLLFMIIKACILFPKDGLGDGFITATFGVGFFSAIAMYGLAFSLPVVALPIINPYNKDIHKRTVVSLSASILCFIIVAVPAIIGYCMFGKDIKDVVINNFADDDVLAIITRVCFLAIVCCSYPCVATSIMGSWGQICFGINLSSEITGVKRVVVFALTNFIPLIIAMFLPNAGPVLSIGGALGGTLVDFFYPALMWIVLSKKKWHHWQNILCIILCVFGVLTAAVSTYLAVIDCIESLS